MTKSIIHPWDEFEIDDRTGLPLIPADQYWKVSFRGGYLLVHLKRKRRLWFPKTIDWTARYMDREGIGKKAVLGMAAIVTREVAKGAPAHDRSLLGNYPPKTLN